MFKGLKITLFTILAVFSVGFLVDLQVVEASVYDDITVNVDPIDPIQLSVTFSGSGNGSVYFSPEGMSCESAGESDCVGSYAPGTSVTLTAEADAASTFSGWSGDCSGPGTCSVTMNSAKNVTATFSLITPSATINASDCTIPSGKNSCSSNVSWSILNATSPNVKQGPAQFSTSVFGNNVSQTIPYGTITFSANDGNTLLKSDDATASCFIETVWSGSVCEGHKTLTVSKKGTGTVTSSPTGIRCGTDCSQSYPYNTEVNLTAEAGTNYIFSSWSGCDTHDRTSCSVTMSSVKNVTANFTAEGKLDGNIYAYSCEVPAGESDCDVYITWDVYNYEAGSETNVTTTPPDNNIVGTGTGLGQSAWYYDLSLNEGTRYFYLYNSGNTDYLDLDYSRASCTTGTTEVNGVCRQNYTVTFDSNGGTGAMSPQTFTSTVSKNLIPNQFTKSDYTFAGWNTSSNGTGTSYADGQSIIVSSGMTLYAMWTIIPINPETYTVTFNANGGTGTMSPQTFTESVPQNLISNTFTKTGNVFAGWNTSSSGTGTSYTDGQSITVSSDMTLYAKWNEMRGTIIASDCEIAEGQSACNTALTWSVQYPVSPDTAVTTPVNQTIFTGHSGSGNYPVEYGGRTFYLYNSEIELGKDTVTPSCVSGTEWNGSICQAIPEMTGNLSVSPTSCEIPYDQESCSVNVSWNVYKPESSNTAVTTSPNGEIFVTGHSGSEDYAFTSPRSVTFYLYNNGKLLAQAIASATKELPPPMTGSITASDCEIAEGQSTCDTTIAWSVQYPVSPDTAVTTPVNQTIFTGHSGSGTYPVEYGERKFYLYNNGEPPLAEDTAIASCVLGTSWLGSSCEGPKTLTVSRTGEGTVTSSPVGISCGADCSKDYAHGTSVTLTVEDDSDYIFSSWSGCDEVNGNTCTVLMDRDRSVTANFVEVWVREDSAVHNSLIYNTTPNTIVPISYTTSSSLSPSECRLLDFEKQPLTDYPYKTDNPISYVSPSLSDSYGYYIQCRNQNNYAITNISEKILVNVVVVSVNLLTNTGMGLPSEAHNFVFIPTSSPNKEELNTVSCQLLDNSKSPLTDEWVNVNLNEPNGISYELPGYLGSFGYYIRCKNNVVTTALADSGVITVTTYCPEGQMLDSSSGKCVAPGLFAPNCVMQKDESSCNTTISWNIYEGDGVWAITTDKPVPNTTLVDITDSNRSGELLYNIPGGVTNNLFFLYNNSKLIEYVSPYAICRTGTLWTYGTCQIPPSSITVDICTIPEGGSSCPTEATWYVSNNPELREDFVFTYPPDNIETGGLTPETLTVTLFYGANHFKVFDGADLIGEKIIPGVCVENTEWDTESKTCVIKEPEINYFKAEPESVFRGQPTTLSWGFEEDRVDYCLLEKKLIIDEIQELLKTIGKEEYQSSLKDSPSGTTVYYMTCYKGEDQTDTKEVTVNVIDMVIEER